MKLLSTILVTLFAALPFVAMASSLEDSYGCNPSTGYTWCSKLQRCARSYECYPPAPKPDSHGCNTGSTGYTWCPVLNKCVAPGKPCVAPPKPVRCNPSTGYTWCSKLQRCARSSECYPSLENAFMNYLTDMNENDEDSIDDGEEEDTIIETYTEGNPREGNLRG